jgi:predicted transcriptional regulator of viral defense system
MPKILEVSWLVARTVCEREYFLSCNFFQRIDRQAPILRQVCEFLVAAQHRAEYCGGITEVAKGLWMRHQDMKATRLVDYALHMATGAVVRRLGYLLECYGIASESELVRLRNGLTETYVPLDPLLPKKARLEPIYTAVREASGNQYTNNKHYDFCQL